MESTLFSQITEDHLCSRNSTLLKGKISTKTKKEAQEKEGGPEQRPKRHWSVCLVFIMALVQHKAFI